MPAEIPRTFHVKSFGCQMNVYDGERMAELLAAQGMTATDERDGADLVVLNTCHIRERPRKRSIPILAACADGTTPLIAVAGCVAQAEGEEIMARAPSVKVWWAAGLSPPARRWPMPPPASAAPKPTCRPKRSSPPCPSAAGPAPARSSLCRKAATSSAPIAWCPIRAARKSPARLPIWWRRPSCWCRRRARDHLLGQNVNAWSGQDAKGRAIGLDGLIRTLAAEPDLARIRYTTSHPNDMSEG
jgi:tRNA-2-methylthio-N6-dimethylallyladenosine synthase